MIFFVVRLLIVVSPEVSEMIFTYFRRCCQTQETGYAEATGFYCGGFLLSDHGGIHRLGVDERPRLH